MLHNHTQRVFIASSYRLHRKFIQMKYLPLLLLLSSAIIQSSAPAEELPDSSKKVLPSGGGGGLIIGGNGGQILEGCNSPCVNDAMCTSPPCPYCKKITATNWQCRPDTCSMACTSSSQCNGRCKVCFAAKCQECQSDSHCQAAFGSAKPYCKRITATNRECRADTCSMFCTSSSECKGKCGVCFAAKCQECQSDSHCQATFGPAKPYCKRITATRRECRPDTCSMFCTSSSECKGKCGVCFAAKCQECQSDSHCQATFGSAKPYCKRITAIDRECRADTCSMFCTSSSKCKGKCGKCRWFKCKEGGGGCFPGSSQVVLQGGLRKPMDSLRIGDTVLTVEDGKIVPTKVLGFLDKRINHKYDFIKLILDGEKSLYISQTHVMFIQGKDGTMKSILAKDAKLGDLVFVKDFTDVTLARIVDMTLEEKTGAYVPLTDVGTLLVDDVLVSCYTNTIHWISHLALSPLRWFPSLLLDTELSQDTEGVRTIPSIVRDLGNTLGLVTYSGQGSTDTCAKKEIIEQCPAMMALQNFVSI